VEGTDIMQISGHNNVIDSGERNIQYWSIDGEYRIYLTRLRNGVKDEL
jgi:hypothetical protein